MSDVDAWRRTTFQRLSDDIDARKSGGVIGQGVSLEKAHVHTETDGVLHLEVDGPLPGPDRYADLPRGTASWSAIGCIAATAVNCICASASARHARPDVRSESICGNFGLASEGLNYGEATRAR